MKSLVKLFSTNKPAKLTVLPQPTLNLNIEQRREAREILMQLKAMAEVKQREIAKNCRPLITQNDHLLGSVLANDLDIDISVLYPPTPGENYYTQAISTCRQIQLVVKNSLRILDGTAVEINRAIIEETMYRAQAGIELAKATEKNDMLLPFGLWARNVGSFASDEKKDKSLYLSTLLQELVAACQQNLYLQSHLV